MKDVFEKPTESHFDLGTCGCIVSIYLLPLFKALSLRFWEEPQACMSFRY